MFMTAICFGASVLSGCAGAADVPVNIAAPYPDKYGGTIIASSGDKLKAGDGITGMVIAEKGGYVKIGNDASITTTGRYFSVLKAVGAGSEVVAGNGAMLSSNGGRTLLQNGHTTWVNDSAVLRVEWRRHHYRKRRHNQAYQHI